MNAYQYLQIYVREHQKRELDTINRERIPVPSNLRSRTSKKKEAEKNKPKSTDLSKVTINFQRNDSSTSENRRYSELLKQRVRDLNK